MKPLKVIFEPDEGGWWTAIIPDVKGVLSDGRTLVEARRRVRQALALASDVGWTRKAASAVPFIEEVRWPSRARALLEEYRAAREALDRAADRVEWATWQTVQELVRKDGRSVRDVASVLGISFQRVHQLAHAPEPSAPQSSGDGAFLVREREARYEATRCRRDGRARSRRRRRG